MRTQSVFRSIPVPVHSVLEIRIPYDIWDKIRLISWTKQRSKSWVVRYTLFRLIKRKSPSQFIGYAGNPRFGGGTVNRLAWQRRVNCRLKHRHRLCLYGEDETLVRLTAASLGCTITHLVRLALETYLHQLFVSLRKPWSRACWGFWYWLGIKHCSDVEFPTRGPTKTHFNFTRFRRTEYF